MEAEHRYRTLISLSLFISLLGFHETAGQGAADTLFIQEYHVPYPIGGPAAANDVRAIAVDQNDNIWAASKAGVFVLRRGERQWSSLMRDSEAGPVFDVAVDNDGTIWTGAWNGLYRSVAGDSTAASAIAKVAGIDHPVAAICVTEPGMVALGPDGLWQIAGDSLVRQPLPCSRSIRAVLSDHNGGLWIATGMGLYHRVAGKTTCYQTESELVSPDLSDIAFARDGSLWIGGLGGITVYRDGQRIATITPKDGLPSAQVRSLTRAPDGSMWVGTDHGVARYDGETWSVRHSRRWLLSDEVRDVAFDSEGTAWIATQAGVSAIKRARMTLAEKAEYFLNVCLSRHLREPGLVGRCRLSVPGDTSTWGPRDDDNDGQYTAMYLAMESYRYAVTKNPRARANAKRAFEALRFLQLVTETPGFVARTVIPISWTRMADANRKLTDQEWAQIRVNNPREKRVENLWRPSRDGKWRWKGNTSSDEITGHMFGYLCYYDLVAGEAEKSRVRQHVGKIMDYIIEGGYVLRDIDGTHTEWAVWSPEKLNHDPDWAAERGINSVEILSFLKVAFHMTGDEKYQRHYLALLHEHNYAANVRHAKTTNPSWRTHIDDELLALAYPALLEYEDNPELRQFYRESLEDWHATVKDEASSYFDFVHAALAGNDGDLDGAVAFLREAPLDLVRWRVDNSRREDIRLVRVPELESWQTHRLLPASERGVMRWDENPWRAVQGDAGHTESTGVYWLLPYWMGRYYGFIRPAD